MQLNCLGWKAVTWYALVGNLTLVAMSSCCLPLMTCRDKTRAGDSSVPAADWSARACAAGCDGANYNCNYYYRLQNNCHNLLDKMHLLRWILLFIRILYCREWERCRRSHQHADSLSDPDRHRIVIFSEALKIYMACDVEFRWKQTTSSQSKIINHLT